MIDVPEELLEQIERGNALLFVGERLAGDVEGQSLVEYLAGCLRERCTFDLPADLPFPTLTQAYEDEHGRQALVQLLRERIQAATNVQAAHRLIASLPEIEVLVTTALDTCLEQAFHEAERALDVIDEHVDIVFEDERRARLYKLRGSLQERPAEVILTEDDYEAFFQNRANRSLVLQGYLARKTILFVGYDLDDALFRRLFNEVTAALDGYARRAHAYGPAPSPAVQRWCKRHGIEVIPVDVTAWLTELVAQMNARRQASAARPPAPPPAPSLPELPYKLLDYYEASDAAIFFGRQQETRALSALIHAHRLVLLYGASGVGKTSLLLAGVVPRLAQAAPPYEVLHVRTLDDPHEAILRHLQRRLPESELPAEGTPVDWSNRVARALQRSLVLVLDQFEELFVRLDAAARAAFFVELQQLYEAGDVPLKIVISLREDWLAAVSEIESHIPQVFATRLRLQPLTREQAREAITAPAQRLGAHYEPALVERLLDDLAGEGVMPPQLQIVCSTLYDARDAEQTIALQTYEARGGTRGILRAYLENEMDALGQDRSLVQALLEEMVTSQGGKAVRTVKELAHALGVEQTALDSLLERLVRRRLLRPLETAEQGRAYELAHDYLVGEIVPRPETQARRLAQELLRQSVENWNSYGSLIDGAQLQRIAPHIDRLALGDTEWTLLLRSALAENEALPFWLDRFPDPQRAAELALAGLLALPLTTPAERLRWVDLADELGARHQDQARWYAPLVDALVAQLSAADPAAREQAARLLACIGPPPIRRWAERLHVYGAGLRLLVPLASAQLLTLALGAALGGLSSGTILVPLGFAMGFFAQWPGLTLSQSVMRWMIVLAPSFGLASALIGLGLGLGLVLGRGRSLAAETAGAVAGGLVGGALVVVYLYIFVPSLVPGVDAALAIPLFAFFCAVLAGLIVYAVRRARRMVRRGQAALQVLVGAAAGALIGLAGDLIVQSIPVLLTTWALFAGGTMVGLSWAEWTISPPPGERLPSTLGGSQ